MPLRFYLAGLQNKLKIGCRQWRVVALIALRREQQHWSNAFMRKSFRKSELKNGLRVVTEHHPSVNSISIGVWIEAGTRDEAPDQVGISHFLEHLVFKGTKRRTAYQIARSLEEVGGDLNAYTTREYTCYHATTLKRDWRLALDVLNDITSNMKISRQDFERERSVVIEEILMSEDDPEDLAYDMFLELQVPGHPLGRRILGTEATLKSLTREKVYDYYQRMYSGANIIVSAAGNLDHDDFVAEVEKLFGKKPRGERVAALRRLRVSGEDLAAAGTLRGESALLKPGSRAAGSRARTVTLAKTKKSALAKASAKSALAKASAKSALANATAKSALANAKVTKGAPFHVPGGPTPQAFLHAVKKPTEQLHLLMGLPCPAFEDPLRFASFLVNAWLGGGMTSHLYQQVREKRGLVYTIYSALHTFTDYGMMNIGASAHPTKMPDVLEEIFKMLARLKTKGMTASEISFYQRQIEGSLILGAEDVENRMNSLAINEMVFGAYRPVDEVIDSIKAVRSKEIRQSLERWSDKELGVLLIGANSTDVAAWLKKERVRRWKF